MAEKSDLNKEYVKELERELRDFEAKSDGNNKTMQMLVYPAMFAFIILAAYGFYLIQSLSSDVHDMSETIASMASSVEKNMDSISGTMSGMSNHMDKLVVSTQSMSTDIGSMNNNTDAMVSSIGGLKSATYDMAASTNNMQRDMWSLNQSISKPLGFMNNFLPWSSNTGSAAPLPPSYYAYPAQQPQNMVLQPSLPLIPPNVTLPVPAATAQGNDDQSSLIPFLNMGGKKVEYNMPLQPSMPLIPASNI
ncbi:MAG TPA: hypothetical protein EYG68_09035 [Leucothrix mucor]|nr:hypothetical protein [Leucothrix mucor]